jgi:hypothetical protein
VRRRALEAELRHLKRGWRQWTHETKMRHSGLSDKARTACVVSHGRCRQCKRRKLSSVARNFPDRSGMAGRRRHLTLVRSALNGSIAPNKLQDFSGCERSNDGVHSLPYCAGHRLQ